MENRTKLLIIDDDPFIIDMYMLKLKQENFELCTASEGKEGLKKIKEFQPDIVLLDIVMPGTDGFDVLKEIKKDPPPHLPKLILLSNLGQKEDVTRGIELGADDYLVKAHFTPSEVVQKIEQVLKKK